VVLAIVVLAGSAAAKPAKPTAEQAKATAEKWLESVSEAAPLTGLPLFSVADADGPDAGCAAATTKTAAELPKRLDCLAKAVTGTEVVAWTKKDAKKLQGALRNYRKKISELEKTAVIVHKHEECAGQGADLVMAVALDKDTPKVVAVLYASVFCGE
jgi:hypothetical protein